MTDIVERLREYHPKSCPDLRDAWEAADEIEQLRAKNESQADYIFRVNRHVHNLKEELDSVGGGQDRG